MNTRTICLAVCLGCAALAATGRALAAEPATPAQADDWTGPYAGLFAGYGWGRARSTAPFDAGPGFFYNFGGDSYSFDVDGLLGGAVAGYGWRSGNTVFGLEAEIGSLGLDGSGLDPNGVTAGFDDTATSFESDFYGALYARVGRATGLGLLYAKGGAAVLNAKASTTDPCVAPPASCGTETLSMSGSRTLLGWSLGGGMEWGLARNWTLRLDYAYFDFGNVDASGVSSAGDPYTQRIGVKAHTARVGISFRW